MALPQNSAWLLASRPLGLPRASNFEWRESSLPPLADGQVLVRVCVLSIDPTNRVWMEDADSYLPRLALGEVMRGIAIGKVVGSRHPGFSPGDDVQGLLGWQTYAVQPGEFLTKLPAIPLPITAYFGLLGHIGFTAYFGLLDIGQPKAGETLVVSAAAGAVGSIAAQIGKILGLRVVGIAGGAEKCRWLRDELGLDAAVDYKAGNLFQNLREACPNGIDVDFENAGGDILDAVLGQMNLHARVVLCGLISQYNDAGPRRGPANFGNILMRRARVQGLIVTDYQARFPEAATQLIAWHLEGKLKYRLDTVEGLENAPAALGKLFDGSNQGKLVVQVSAD